MVFWGGGPGGRCIESEGREVDEKEVGEENRLAIHTDLPPSYSSLPPPLSGALYVNSRLILDCTER